MLKTNENVRETAVLNDKTGMQVTIGALCRYVQGNYVCLFREKQRSTFVPAPSEGCPMSFGFTSFVRGAEWTPN